MTLVLAGAMSMQVRADEAPPRPEETRRAKVFATVGSRTITVGELEDMINARSPYARKRLTQPKALKRFADDQMQNELYFQGAEKRGLAQDPEVEKLVDHTLVQLFVREEIEEAVTPEDVSEDAVVKYYEDNPEQFRRVEMRRGRHILVASQEEAKELLEELRAEKGTPFRALAKQKSLDTETKLRGGDLLYFTRDGTVVGKQGAAPIDPTLAKAAFGLAKTGDLSKPLDLGDGKWSVLELTGIRPEKVQTLEQASGAIRGKLWREGRKAALDELMTELRTELKPEVYPERMDAIVLPPPTAPLHPPNQ